MTTPFVKKRRTSDEELFKLLDVVTTIQNNAAELAQLLIARRSAACSEKYLYVECDDRGVVSDTEVYLITVSNIEEAVKKLRVG